MSKAPRDNLDTYLAAGESWAADRNQALRASRRIAWIVAACALAVAVCEALALVTLAPLKTIVPYTLMVDRQTGFVQALKPLDAQTISADAALTQSFLVQYVIAREGYDANSVQADYRKVALWSTGTARASYVAGMQATSGTSPVALYPRSTVIAVAVKSVTSLGPQTAMVRFDTERRDGTAATPLGSWVAVIRYAYSGAPMRAADRYLNPLGFQVLRYRRSAETLSPPATPATVYPPTAAPYPRTVPQAPGTTR